MILTCACWPVTLVLVDVLAQVDRLLSNLDAIENEQRIAHETARAILLQSAMEEYLELVRKGDWPKARTCLHRVLQVANYIVADLPTSESGEDLAQ